MKSISRGILLLILIQCGNYSHAQSTRIGDQWPDVAFKSVLNYSKEEIRLSDFKGKFIIIHFWTRSCQPCIAALPKLEKLQQEFAGKIQIILINNEDKTATEKFFIEKKNIKRPHLPMATGEIKLFNLFRLIGDVWLDTNRKTRYVSEAYNITSKNINDFLSGDDAAITQRVLFDDFNPQVPLIAEGNGRWLDSVKQYSYFYKSTFPIKESRDNLPIIPGNKPNRIYLNYYSIMTLYKFAFNEYKKYNYDVILEVKDSARFIRPKDEDLMDKWDAENHYTYDLLVPANRTDQLYKFMQTDLERFFGVKGTIENRKINCLVLELTDNGEKLKTSNSKSRQSNSKDTAIYFYKLPFARFSNYLRGISTNYTSLPFKDETGVTSDIDIVLNKEKVASGKLSALQEELGKYGLHLCERLCEKKVLVLTD